MSDAEARLERLLGGSELVDLRRRLRRRFELARNSDRFTLSSLSPRERHALESLLGRRPSLSSSIELSKSELTEALVRAGLASSLRHALERLDGPIRDVAVERASKAARWDSVFLNAPGPSSSLPSSGSGKGLVKRLAGDDPDEGGRLLAATAAVLMRLPAQGVPLSHFAADVLGDAHALDDGAPVSTLALAALRADIDERPRDVWARHGILPGELAAPVLILNLPGDAESPGGMLARRAMEVGEPLHLSLRCVLRTPPAWPVRGRVVYVCENQSVVAVAADRLGGRCAPLVCTDGMPSASHRAILAQLAERGAELRYHGDFDWAGLIIGNFIVRTFGAKPWRFGAADYEASRGRKLAGLPVPAAWDPDLSAKMARAGYALEEEAVVDTLLSDLCR